MAIQLETGKYLLSPEQVQELRPAADRLRDDKGRLIELTQPIAFEEWFDLVVVQATLDGDDESLDLLCDLLEGEIAKRKRPN